MTGAGAVYSVGKSAYGLLHALRHRPMTVGELVAEASDEGRAVASWQMDAFVTFHMARGALVEVEGQVRSDGCGDREAVRFPDLPWLSAPLWLGIVPFRLCNQACAFCISGSSTGAPSPPEDPPRWFHEALLLAGRMDVAGVGLFGGEPLLRPLWVKAAIRAGAGRWSVLIMTNGNVPPANLEAAFPCVAPAEAAIEIVVSLHGVGARTHDGIVGCRGAFERAVGNIRELAARKFRVTVHTVPTADNLGELPEMPEVVEELGGSAWALLDHRRCDRSAGGCATRALTGYAEAIREVREAARGCGIEVRVPGEFPGCGERAIGDVRYRCAAGTFSIVVGPDGGIYPCLQCEEDETFRMGSVEDAVAGWWESEKWVPFRECRADRLEDPRCLECPARETCLGGCPMSAYRVTGSLWGRDPACPRETGGRSVPPGA